MKVNWSTPEVAEVPPAVVTVVSTVPAPSAGVTAVIWVGELTENDVAAALPNFTALAPLNPVPVMVTEVVPEVGPSVGLIPLTVGAGT